MKIFIKITYVVFFVFLIFFLEASGAGNILGQYTSRSIMSIRNKNISKLFYVDGICYKLNAPWYALKNEDGSVVIVQKDKAFSFSRKITFRQNEINLKGDGFKIGFFSKNIYCINNDRLNLSFFGDDFALLSNLAFSSVTFCK